MKESAIKRREGYFSSQSEIKIIGRINFMLRERDKDREAYKSQGSRDLGTVFYIKEFPNIRIFKPSEIPVLLQNDSDKLRDGDYVFINGYFYNELLSERINICVTKMYKIYDIKTHRFALSQFD